MKKIVAVFTVMLLLMPTFSFVLTSISDESEADAPINGTMIGRGINLLDNSINIKDLDMNFITFNNNVLGDVGSLIHKYNTTYENKSETYSESIEEYMKSYGTTVGFGVGVGAGAGPFYAGVENLTEIGTLITTSKTAKYSLYSKTWTIRTDAVVLTETNPQVLSTLLSSKFNDSIAALKVKHDNGTITVGDYWKLFTDYGTHINLGYYNGGESTTTAIYSSSSYGVDIEEFIRNTTTITGGIGIKDLCYVEANNSFSKEFSKSVSVNKEKIYCEKSCITKGGNSALSQSKNYSNTIDEAWANSVKEGLSPAIIGFVDGHLLPLWELLPEGYGQLALDLERYFYSKMNSNYFEFCELYDFSPKKDLKAVVDELVTINGIERTIISKDTNEKVMMKGSKGLVQTNINSYGLNPSALKYNVELGGEYLEGGKINPDGTFRILSNSPTNAEVRITTSVEAGGFLMLSDPITIKISEFTLGKFAGGGGTENSPFLIENWNHMNEIRSTIAGKFYYKLMSDLYWTSGDWLPFGDERSGAYKAFNGYFDGNNFKIHNLRLNGGDHNDDGRGYLGLFAYINGGSVSNLTFINPVLSHYYGKEDGRLHAGGIVAGRLDNNSVISNCNVESCSINIESVDWESVVAGGIVAEAYNNSVVKKCSVTGNISVIGCEAFAGGIVGYISSAKVTDCFAYTDLYSKGWRMINKFGSSYVGGIAGQSVGGTFVQCIADGSVDAISVWTIAGLANNGEGGIVGLCAWTTTYFGYCYHSMHDVSANAVTSNAYAWEPFETCVVFHPWSDLNYLDRNHWAESIWQINWDNAPSFVKGTELIDPSTSELTKLQTKYIINGNQNKEYFNSHHIYDDSSMKTTMNLSNGSTKTVEPDSISQTIDGNLLHVTMYYGPLSKTFTLELVEKELFSIDVLDVPTKLVYESGESFERDGLKVIATYTDGSVEDISSTCVLDMDLSVGDQNVNVSYEKAGIIRTDSFSIKINDYEGDSEKISLRHITNSVPMFYKVIDNEGVESDRLKMYLAPFEIGHGEKLKLSVDYLSMSKHILFDKWVVNGEVYTENTITIEPNGSTSIILITKSSAEAYDPRAIGFLTAFNNLTFLESENMSIPKELFDKLAVGDYSIKILSDEGGQYTWYFEYDGAEVKSDIILNANLKDITGDELNLLLNESNYTDKSGLLMDFEMSGTLPSGTSFIINADQYKIGDVFKLYYNDNGAWMDQGVELSVSEDYKIKVNLEHCSQYLLVSQPADNEPSKELNPIFIYIGGGALVLIIAIGAIVRLKK